MRCNFPEPIRFDNSRKTEAPQPQSRANYDCQPFLFGQIRIWLREYFMPQSAFRTSKGAVHTTHGENLPLIQLLFRGRTLLEITKSLIAQLLGGNISQKLMGSRSTTWSKLCGTCSPAPRQHIRAEKHWSRFGSPCNRPRERQVRQNQQAVSALDGRTTT